MPSEVFQIGSYVVTLGSMAIELQILGTPGNDNAALVRINTGQAIHRLLFDCGEGVFGNLEYSEILAIDHLFFSHLHMDHVAGFDAFFRGLYGRDTKTNHIWGPAQTARIMQHRFCGIIWNLHEGANATWYVHDVLVREIKTFRYELSDAFETACLESSKHHNGTVFEGTVFEGTVLDGTVLDCTVLDCTVLEHHDFTVHAVQMNHGTPSMAYIVRETDRVNLRSDRMAALGLKPGAWVRELKNPAANQVTIVIDGQTHDLQNLQTELLEVSRGDAVAYLTDFLLDELAMQVLVPALSGVRLLLCESQYLQADSELATRNFHMTSTQAATLATRAQVQELVLFHVSDRYSKLELDVLLQEAQAIFPNTRFPAHW
jgi:ribonuclease Z